jgi:hypothetical protein
MLASTPPELAAARAGAGRLQGGAAKRRRARSAICGSRSEPRMRPALQPRAGTYTWHRARQSRWSSEARRRRLEEPLEALEEARRRRLEEPLEALEEARRRRLPPLRVLLLELPREQEQPLSRQLELPLRLPLLMLPLLQPLRQPEPGRTVHAFSSSAPHARSQRRSSCRRRTPCSSPCHRQLIFTTRVSLKTRLNGVKSICFEQSRKF